MTARYLVGDVLDVLATLPDASVDLVATSPPFLNLRSYLSPDHPTKPREIGSERTPADWLDTLLDVVEACDRVLAAHGSIAFEIGDRYAGSGGAGGDYDRNGQRDGQPRWVGSAAWARKDDTGQRHPSGHGNGWPLEKSLCGIPSLFAYSLAYGRNLLRPLRTIEPWRVRNLVAWCRPNPPVGALSDKCRPATSYITVATKSRDRWWDMDACRYQVKDQRTRLTNGAKNAAGDRAQVQTANYTARVPSNPAGAPLLDHWTIPTEPSSLAHYAMWPQEVARRLILLMCPAEVCRECGEPRRRMVEAERIGVADDSTRRKSIVGANPSSGFTADVPEVGWEYERTTLGWSDCGHDDYRRGLVLDPFCGSGTTLAVACQLGRDSIGIDLDERNADLARKRVGPYGVLEVVGRDGAVSHAGQAVLL